MTGMKATSTRLTVLVGFLSLLCVSFAAGEVEERADLRMMFPGSVFLYSGEPGQLPYPCVYDSEDEMAAIPRSGDISLLHYCYRNARVNGKGPGFSLSQEVGSQRLKRLGKCLDEGGQAWNLVAHGNYCYVGTCATVDVYDVTNTTTPVLVHRIQEPSSALEITGNLMVGTAGWQGDLVIYDISVPDTPSEISRLPAPDGFYYVNLTVNGSLAAVMASGLHEGFGWGTLMQLIDISNPQAPQVMTTLMAINTHYRAALIQDDYLYLTVNYQGLAVFDISDPSKLIQVGFSAIYPYIDAMVYQDGYLFCAGKGLEVVDVSDPYEPELVAQLGPGYTSDIEIYNDIAFITDDDDYSLRIIDVADPLDPKKIIHHQAYGSVWHLDILGNKVFLPDMVYGLIILDVTNPASPVEDSTTPTGVRPYGVDVEDGLAVVTSSLAHVHTVDVSDPFAPVQIGSHVPAPDTVPSNTTSLFGLDLVGDYAAISDQYWGVRMYNVTDPNDPKPAGTLKVGNEYNPVVQYGDVLFTGYDELLVIDITDPEDLKQVATGPAFPDGLYDIKIVGETCYATGYNEVVIIDITNPLSVMEIKRFSPPPEVENVAGIAVENDLLGLLGQTFSGIDFFSTFSLYDVSDPEEPVLLSYTKFPVDILIFGVLSGTTNVAVKDGLFFMRNWDNMVVFDASDPVNPHLVAVYAEPPRMTGTGPGFTGVHIIDDLVYLTGHHGLEILRFLDVGLFLTPTIDPVIVKQGESFSYEMKIENFTSEPQTVLASVDNPFPGGGSQGPQAGPIWVTLHSGESMVYTRMVEIPVTAPAGTYHLNGSVRGFPDVPFDDDRITFEVVTD